MEMNYKNLVNNQKKNYMINIGFWVCIFLIFLIVAFIFVGGFYFNFISLIVWITFFLYFCFFFYKIVESIDYLIAFKKYIKTISQNQIDIINEELKNVLAYQERNYIVTENYIFFLHSKFSILEYQDIVLVGFKIGVSSLPEFGYVNVQFNGFYLCKKLYVVLKSGKKYSFDLRKDSYYSDKLIDILVFKNKDILIGKSKRNKKIMLEKYGKTTRAELLENYKSQSQAWESYLTDLVKTASRYDKEIEYSADYRPKEILYPQQVWGNIADIKNINNNNINHVINAKKLIKRAHENDYQRRF